MHARFLISKATFLLAVLLCAGTSFAADLTETNFQKAAKMLIGNPTKPNISKLLQILDGTGGKVGDITISPGVRNSGPKTLAEQNTLFDAMYAVVKSSEFTIDQLKQKRNGAIAALPGQTKTVQTKYHARLAYYVMSYMMKKADTTINLLDDDLDKDEYNAIKTFAAIKTLLEKNADAAIVRGNKIPVGVALSPVGKKNLNTVLADLKSYGEKNNKAVIQDIKWAKTELEKIPEANRTEVQNLQLEACNLLIQIAKEIEEDTPKFIELIANRENPREAIKLGKVVGNQNVNKIGTDVAGGKWNPENVAINYLLKFQQQSDQRDEEYEPWDAYDDVQHKIEKALEKPVAKLTSVTNPTNPGMNPTPKITARALPPIPVVQESPEEITANVAANNLGGEIEKAIKYLNKRQILNFPTFFSDVLIPFYKNLLALSSNEKRAVALSRADGSAYKMLVESIDPTALSYFDVLKKDRAALLKMLRALHKEGMLVGIAIKDELKRGVIENKNVKIVDVHQADVNEAFEIIKAKYIEIINVFRQIRAKPA